MPVEVNTPGGSISKLLTGFPGLFIQEVDGCDVLASYDVLVKAVEYARARKGPALVHAHVIRPYSHSLSDDEVHYRPPAERQADAERDPAHPVPEAICWSRASPPRRSSTRSEAGGRRRCRWPPRWRSRRPSRAPTRSTTTSTRPTSIPPASSSIPRTIPASPAIPRPWWTCSTSASGTRWRATRGSSSSARTWPTAAGRTTSADVKGKGGVFKVTWGLQRAFGSDRVYNSPLAEANIIGRAIGLATRGLKPVVEIQFFDYIWPAYMQLRNELALMRWRSNNAFAAPVVVRVTYGGYLKGGSVYHSQTGAAVFTSVPGLRVVCPATALDANGLLRTAIRCDDPVMFLEHKHLYRQTYNKAPNPGPQLHDPARQGQGRPAGHRSDRGHLRRGGAAGAVRPPSERRSSTGSAPRSSTCARSRRWTGRRSTSRCGRPIGCIVAYEDSMCWGYGAEIAARIADETVRLPRRTGQPGRRHRYLRGLRARAGGRDPASDRRPARGHGADRPVLMCRRCGAAMNNGALIAGGPVCRDRLAAIMPLRPRKRERSFASEALSAF